MPSIDADARIMGNEPSRLDFNATAGSYDRWYDTAEGRMYDRLERKAISRYLPRNAQGMKLLEVGCGTGHWSRFFSEHGFEVTGVDVSGRMIETAQSKYIPNASFQIADGHYLPFADGSFDLTAAITALEFVRDTDAVLREMVRCTRKNGGLLLIGALNSQARVNVRRKQDSKSLYARARLFSPKQLLRLLEPYGTVRIVTAGFVPKPNPLLPIAPLLDAIGRLLRMPSGAFIAAEVKL